MNNRTEIILCVDRSGSMRSIAADMEGGLQTLVAEQAALPGECTITYCRFDSQYEEVFVGRPANEVALSDLRIDPRGPTALLDAMARTIDDAVARHEKLDSTEVPSKVLLVVITDGQENASRNVTHAAVLERVTACKAKGWDVLFLGANQDSISVGATLGVSAASSMDFQSTTRGVRKMSERASSYATTYRST